MQNKLCEFIVLGVLLMIVSAVLSVLLMRRLERRVGLPPDKM